MAQVIIQSAVTNIAYESNDLYRGKNITSNNQCSKTVVERKAESRIEKTDLDLEFKIYQRYVATYIELRVDQIKQIN